MLVAYYRECANNDPLIRLGNITLLFLLLHAVGAPSKKTNLKEQFSGEVKGMLNVCNVMAW